MAAATKQECQEKLWEITIASPPTFKTLINIIDSILTQVVFRVVATPAFTGLKVDEMNAQQTCLLRCQYECQVQAFDGFTIDNHSFCIPCNILGAVLRTVNDGYVLKIIGYKYNAPHVTVLTYETDRSVNATRSIINVIQGTVHTYSEVEFEAKKVVDIDLMSLKNMVKSAKDLKSPYIKFSIATPVTPKQHDMVDNLFTICVEGDAASLSRTFHSSTRRDIEGGDFEEISYNTVATTETSGEQTLDFIDGNTDSDATEQDATVPPPPVVDMNFGNVKTVFCEAYSTQLLNDVVRHMDKGGVQLYMCPQKPLFLKHPIAENSHVISLFSGCIVE